MKEKQPKKNKNSFHLRIYDAEVLKSLNELFEVGDYESMNELLNDALRVGAEKIYLEFGKRKLLTQPLAFPEKSDGKKLDDVLHEQSKQKLMQEDMFILMNSIEAIVSSIFNMQRAGVVGEPLSAELIDSGYYNALPDNFREIKDSLIKRFNRKLSKEQKKGEGA